MEPVEGTPEHTIDYQTLRKQHRLDADGISLLVAQYLDGESVSKLAREWTLHRDTVLNHLKRHGVSRRPYVRKMTDAQVAAAAELYRAGNSLAVLGQRYSVDPQTVSKELRAVGVQIRPPGRWG